MRLTRGYHYYRGTMNLCIEQMEEVFGAVSEQIDVIISKRPMLGSKCFYRQKAWVTAGPNWYKLLPSVCDVLDMLKIKGRFYVRIEPCD